jgi:hypothetical protein
MSMLSSAHQCLLTSVSIVALLSFTEVLEKMRGHLKKKGFTQIPQLSSMNPIDVNHKFDLVPETATGTRRAVMIGINYVGELLFA